MNGCCGSLARMRVAGLTASLLFFATTHAHAQGWAFWRDSPFANMNEEDMESFRSEIQKALEEAPDREVISWEAPSGERTGKIVSRLTYESHGKTCRRLAFQMTEGDMKQSHHFDMCKGDSEWEVVAAPVNFSQSEQTQLREFLTTVLEQQDRGIPIAWTGSESKSTVVVVPLDDQQEDACRNAAININREGIQQLSGQYRFCTEDDGEWHYRPE